MQEVRDLYDENQRELNLLDSDYNEALAIVDQAAQIVQGAQPLNVVLQQQIDAIQASFDSNNQRIQEIEAEIEGLQNQINELNNM